MDQIQARTEELKEKLKESKARSGCVGDGDIIAGEISSGNINRSSTDVRQKELEMSSIGSDVSENAEQGENDQVNGYFCDGDIDMGTEIEKSTRKLAGSVGFVQVQEPLLQVQGEGEALLPSDLLTDILLKNDEKPVAKITPSDLEEASESKFGKTIAKMECTQGARQNAQTENPSLKTQTSMSYVGAVTRSVTKELRTNNFSGKSLMKLEYTPYKRSDGVPKIALTPEFEAMEKWKKCLVGYFIGVKLPFHIVKSEIFKRWRGEGLQRIAYTASGFYLLDFDDEKSRDKALDNGPIHIFGRALVLKKWHLMMSLSKETCDNIPIWVNFHNLPYEFWSGESLGKIASVLGKPLYADQATENQTRVTFARVCIEIDAKEEKVETIRVECDGKSVDVGVKYQWYPLRCGDCKVFGHSISSCPVKTKEKEVMVSIKNIEAQANNNPRKQDAWKEVRRGKNESNIKGSPREPVLTLRNSFDVMKGCEDSECVKETQQQGDTARGKMLDAMAKAHLASVPAKAQELIAQPGGSSATGSGLLGSDEIFGSGKRAKAGNKEEKDRRKTETSKLKDRKGNVLPFKEVKRIRGDKEEIKPSACCEGGNAIVPNPEMDVSLFEAFDTKEEGSVGSPMHKKGLSISDYPSDWSTRRIKKAIRAVQLAGPPKGKDDPP